MSVRPAELTLYELPSVIQQFKARSPRSLSEGLKKDDPWLGEVAVAVTNALIRRSVHLGMLFCGHILRGGASHLFFCCVLRFLRTASSY
jgi:hypothetical protein